MARKKKKAKLDTAGVVLLLLGLAGAVVAVVGLFVPWFASKPIIGDVGYSGLFGDGLGDLDEFLKNVDSFFPAAMVQTFGIIAAVFAVVAALVLLLKALNIVKIGFLVRLVFAAAAVVFGILALIFAFNYIGNFADLGKLIAVGPAFGLFFTAVGGIVSGAALLLKK